MSVQARILNFYAVCGHDDERVQLGQHPGGGEGYHLYIETIYWAQFQKRQDNWWVWIKPGPLETPDLLACVELIEPGYDTTKVIICKW